MLYPLRVSLRWASLLGAIFLLTGIVLLQRLMPDCKNYSNGREPVRQVYTRSVITHPEHKNTSPDAEEELPPAAATRLKGHNAEFYCIAFSPDQKTVVASDLQGYIGWWVFPTGVNKHLTEVRGGMIHALATSRNGQFVATGNVGSLVQLWNLSTGKHLHTFSVPSERRGGVEALAFSPDDTILAVAEESTIYHWELRSGKKVRSIDTGDLLKALVWDANNNFLATGHAARVIDPENPAVDDRVRTESRVQLWNASTGKRERILRWGKGSIFALSFSPDGRILAAGDSHRTGRLVFWDTSTGRELATVVAHPETAESRQRSENSTEALPPLGGVRSIAFSSDGRLLVSGGGDGLVRVWEASTAKELCHFDAGRNPRHASDFVYSVAFAPDGNTVASAHERGLALLWNLRRTIAGEKPLSATLNAPQLEACWTDLESPQPLRAYRAIEQLRASSRVSVPFIKDHLRPMPATDARLIARWIADLDSDDFSVREKARGSLQKAVDQAEEALRKALAARPSLEARRRINDLLSTLEKSRTSAARLRAVRTLCVLERIGTPEAREVIESLAKKDSRPWLTQDAESALRRLKASVAPRP